jgi:hypothetical protein
VAGAGDDRLPRKRRLRGQAVGDVGDVGRVTVADKLEDRCRELAESIDPVKVACRGPAPGG